MSEIKATRRSGASECRDPGDFFFEEGDVWKGELYLRFLCPCGCGKLDSVRVRMDGLYKDGAWGWNRNKDNPTVMPSLRLVRDNESQSINHWYGYLTAGVFRSV